MNLLNFSRVRHQISVFFAPDDDRRNHKSRTGSVIIETPKNAITCELEPDFFSEFA